MEVSEGKIKGGTPRSSHSGGNENELNAKDRKRKIEVVAGVGGGVGGAPIKLPRERALLNEGGRVEHVPDANKFSAWARVRR